MFIQRQSIRERDVPQLIVLRARNASGNEIDRHPARTAYTATLASRMPAPPRRAQACERSQSSNCAASDSGAIGAGDSR